MQLDDYVKLPYAITLRPDEDGDWIAEIETLEGCVAHGETQAEALSRIEEVKRLWIQAGLEHGQPIPMPVLAKVEGTSVMPRSRASERRPMDRYVIPALLFQEGERWSAQCLRYDIACQAKNLPELHVELGRTLVGHMVVSKELGLEPFENLGAAPQVFWDMVPEVQSALTIDSIEAALDQARGGGA